MSALTKEENQELADNVLRPIMQIVAENIHKFDVDRMKESYKNMKSHTGTARAFPFPETQDKADAMDEINNVFAAIILLFELRKVQMEGVSERERGKQGINQLLKDIGMDFQL